MFVDLLADLTAPWVASCSQSEYRFEIPLPRLQAILGINFHADASMDYFNCRIYRVSTLRQVKEPVRGLAY